MQILFRLTVFAVSDVDELLGLFESLSFAYAEVDNQRINCAKRTRRVFIVMAKFIVEVVLPAVNRYQARVVIIGKAEEIEAFDFQLSDENKVVLNNFFVDFIVTYRSRRFCYCAEKLFF